MRTFTKHAGALPAALSACPYARQGDSREEDRVGPRPAALAGRDSRWPGRGGRAGRGGRGYGFDPVAGGVSWCVRAAADDRAGPRRLGQRFVLVGHSYGGAVITNAATGDSQVKALVYVDAFAPDQGQTVGQLASSVPGSCVLATDPTTIFDLATYPGAPAGVYDAYYKQSLFPACFANGLPLSEAKVLASTQEPLSTIALSQPSGVPAWKTIPSWAVVGTADRVILPAIQLAMARHAHAHITEVKAPHLSMVAAPGVVTKVILNAVHATG